jgi:heme oxygenase
MQRLRLETRDQHRKLEHTVDLKSRFESRAEYVDLLQRMLGLHEPLEQALLRLDWSGTGIEPGERRKSPWLEADLMALGNSAAEIARLPRCAELPVLDTLARGIGCLYVLEGSTLGGDVIARQLATRLQMGPGNGARFYASYGERLHAMWATFGADADRACNHQAACDEARDAARDTFECFERWFGRAPPERPR